MKNMRRFTLEDADVPPCFLGCRMKNSHLEPELQEQVWNFVLGDQTFLIVNGDCGRGKTWNSIAAIDLWQSETGLGARFINISECYHQWLDEIRTSGLRTLISRLIQVDFLVLDDIGLRSPSEAWLDVLYLLINSRMNYLRKTIITTNLDEQQLVKNVGQRITSRLMSGSGIEITGSDRRR